MGIALKNILAQLAALYPPEWAMAGDRVGLMAGHPETPVKVILVALEVSPAVVEEAKAQGAQLLLTHHPLLYHPLEVLREDQPQGALLKAVIQAGLAVAAVHTNLDAAPDGLNDYLARRLGLANAEILAETAREPMYKLAVFVPRGYEDRVRAALADDRVGVIGRYSHCTFASPGQGTFLPEAGAQPFEGRVGALSRAAESRLEILVPGSRLAAALDRLRQAHPYEEVAYDLYPLKNPGPPIGLGRVGDWPEPKAFSEVVSLVKEVFGPKVIRVWGQAPETVQRAAVLGGSGGDLIEAARDRGAQVFITGEARYHQAAPWGPFGPAILEVGHFESEVVFMPEWAAQLSTRFHEAGMDLQVQVAAREAHPCEYC